MGISVNLACALLLKNSWNEIRARNAFLDSSLLVLFGIDEE